MAIIRGDLVEHKEFDYGIGRAAHAEPTGDRWVAWMSGPGKWGAGLYKPAKLRLVGRSAPTQGRLGLSGKRDRG